MPSLSFYEAQHVQRLIQQEGSLKLIFDTFSRRTGKIMERWSDSGSSDVWDHNSAIEKEIEKELSDLRTRLIKNINDFSLDAWERSNLKTDDLITGFVKDLPINKTIKDGLFSRNNEALKAFQARKMDNLTISERVWKATATAKSNIEYYLQSGLSTGRSANLISQDLRQLLANPDKQFHRIRNADGKLIPSAPMAAYHPGQGVYRSSFMNAKRLAVTETNGAYRSADSERWNKLGFVIGILVSRSSSGGPCSICDALIGTYPKDFKFWGWHPFCICYATPILMSQDDFMKQLSGEVVNVEYIQDIPTDARAYMQDKLDSGKVTLKSYLFSENAKYFDNKSNVDSAIAGKSHEELSKIFIEERNKNKRFEFMSPLSVESIKDSKILMINDGKTGCIIATDGDLQNVFNNAGKGDGSTIIKIAIQNGAKKLDCFEGFLPEYYSRFGFKEVKRIKWDDNYAPPNWDYTKYGRPDVVFMEL